MIVLAIRCTWHVTFYSANFSKKAHFCFDVLLLKFSAKMLKNFTRFASQKAFFIDYFGLFAEFLLRSVDDGNNESTNFLSWLIIDLLWSAKNIWSVNMFKNVTQFEPDSSISAATRKIYKLERLKSASLFKESTGRKIIILRIKKIDFETQC